MSLDDYEPDPNSRAVSFSAMPYGTLMKYLREDHISVKGPHGQNQLLDRVLVFCRDNNVINADDPDDLGTCFLKGTILWNTETLDLEIQIDEVKYSGGLDEDVLIDTIQLLSSADKLTVNRSQELITAWWD